MKNFQKRRPIAQAEREQFLEGEITRLTQENFQLKQTSAPLVVGTQHSYSQGFAAGLIVRDEMVKSLMELYGIFGGYTFAATITKADQAVTGLKQLDGTVGAWLAKEDTLAKSLVEVHGIPLPAERAKTITFMHALRQHAQDVINHPSVQTLYAFQQFVSQHMKGMEEVIQDARKRIFDNEVVEYVYRMAALIQNGSSMRKAARQIAREVGITEEAARDAYKRYNRR